MGTMNKLRENTGVVLWILVISFGVIWVLQDSGAFDVAGAPTRDVIVVNGETISYDEYQSAVESQMDAYRQRTGQTLNSQQIDQISEQVFNMLVENRLREQAMDRIGIAVTEEEIYNMVLGDNPHQIIRTYFGDENGNVDRALLQNFIDNPEAKQQWIQIENYLRAERRREKLDGLLAASVRISEQDVLDEYQRRNREVDAEYVALRYTDLPDDSIEVTERDLRRYYNDHRDDFERKRAYTIRYAALSSNPSSQDTTVLMQDLASMRADFAEAEDDSTFLQRFGSERSYSSAYFRRDELDEPIADAVFETLEPGRVVGPILAGGQAHLVKILDVRDAEEPSVRARHMLFRAPEDDEAERTEARRAAQDVLQQLRTGADFEALAREHSDDPGSARNGGDLGWFGPGQMVDAFEDAALDAPVGEVVGPVETRFGYHLIQVTDRAAHEVQIADYAQTLRPSPATLNEAEERLGDLRYYASESGSFDEEAERLGLEVQSVQVEEDQQYIPDIGMSRSLMNFLERADRGDISEVIELNEQFMVAYVEEIRPGGYRPFEEVRSEIEPRVKIEKKKAVQRDRMARAFAEVGFDGLADAFGVPKRTARQVTASNPVVPTLGRAPVFTGTVLGLDEGEVSPVTEGENAVFVARVVRVHEPPPITEQQKQQLRNELLQQRRSELQQRWIAELREDADIQDNRSEVLQ